MVDYVAGTESKDFEAPELSAYLGNLIQECENYSDFNIDYRETALEYYHGEIKDMTPELGRSRVVSQDLRANVRKLRPSITRTLFRGHDLVKYKPTGPGDEVYAEQASAYVNHVVLPECNAEEAIYDAVFDAMVLKTGILKWYWDDSVNVKEFQYTRQPEEIFLAMMNGSDGEVLDATQDPKDGTYDFVFRRIYSENRVKLKAISRDSFLIHPNARSIKEAMICGERMYITRSDLVAQGYPKDVVDQLEAYQSRQFLEEDEVARRGERYYYNEQNPSAEKALEEVLVYDVYIKMDQDGDGIHELYQFIISDGTPNEPDSGGSGWVVLEQNIVPETPYGDIKVEREAHIFEGHSIFDDMGDLQQIKTILLREFLDNIYWQNTPQPAVDRSKVINVDAVINPTFGRPIFLKPGTKVSDAIQWTNIPFIGDKTLVGLDYIDRVAKERTGITDMSGGVDPKAFQDMSATGASIVSESGTAQAENMIHIVVQGLGIVFKGILGLIIRHADPERVVRINNQWEQFDPRTWNADMDCMVDVGMGAGSKEKELQGLSLIKNIQTEVATTMGASNPMVNVPEIYHTIEKIVQTLGYPAADPFFKKLTPEQIKEVTDQAAKQPSEEERKAEAQIKIEQAKAQITMQVEQGKAQVAMQIEQAKAQVAMQIEQIKVEASNQVEQIKSQERVRVEAAQLEADTQVKQAETQAILAKADVDNKSKERIAAQSSNVAILKVRGDAESKLAELELERDELALKRQELVLRREEMNLKAQVDRERNKRGTGND